jgi:hypothetical protein
VTCRTQEYEELRDTYAPGLGLVQAVEILPLSSEQLDSAFVELARRDREWESFLSKRHHTAYQRVRDLLSNPLFLNLAVIGHLSPSQLLDWSTTEQELRDLVLESYLDRTLADQRQYESEDARRHLAWIARFLNRDEVSPFGLKETDFTVFDLADLTPPDPPRRYRLLEGPLSGLVWVLVFVLVTGVFYGLGSGQLSGLVGVLLVGVVIGLALGLRNGGWFVWLQKVAHRRLARAGNLPPRPYDFLEWGIDRQIFRRVGGGVRFRHNLIQQHLANTSHEGA